MNEQNTVQPPPRASRKLVARQIAAVMRNPATPAALYNAIADELTFYANFIEYNSPNVIEMSLKAFQKAAEEAGSENNLMNNRERKEAEDEEKIIG